MDHLGAVADVFHLLSVYQLISPAANLREELHKSRSASNCGARVCNLW